MVQKRCKWFRAVKATERSYVSVLKTECDDLVTEHWIVEKQSSNKLKIMLNNLMVLKSLSSMSAV